MEFTLMVGWGRMPKKRVQFTRKGALRLVLGPLFLWVSPWDMDYVVHRMVKDLNELKADEKQ